MRARARLRLEDATLQARTWMKGSQAKERGPPLEAREVNTMDS